MRRPIVVHQREFHHWRRARLRPTNHHAQGLVSHPASIPRSVGPMTSDRMPVATVSGVRACTGQFAGGEALRIGTQGSPSA